MTQLQTRHLNTIFDEWNPTSDDGDDIDISSSQLSPLDLYQLQHPLAHSSPSPLLSPSPTLANSSPGSLTKYSATSQESTSGSSRITPSPSLLTQPAPTPSTSNQTSNAIKSNRTVAVNHEIRVEEFKTLLAENKRTNELLETLVSLKKAKYTAKGYI